MIEPNREFDPLASTYDRCWGAEYHREAFPVVQQLLLSRLSPGANLLDVCCGTGQFTRRVQDEGFLVTGIDASERMLGFARENVPGSCFFAADVREFALGETFDGAYSVFESLNHVPDLDGLSAAFGCVRKHLKPGAPFLFDLNGEEAFIRFWNDTDAIVEADRVCVLRSDYDADTGAAQCRVTLFEQTGDWERYDFTLRQTCHDIEHVCSALEKTGFSGLTLYDAQDAGMSEHTGFHRTFFLAQAD